MTKYLLVYQGQMDGPMPELSQEESDAMMQAWGDWMGRVGPALADGGAPTGDRARIGGSGTPLPITRWRITASLKRKPPVNSSSVFLSVSTFIST